MIRIIAIAVVYSCFISHNMCVASIKTSQKQTYQMLSELPSIGEPVKNVSQQGNITDISYKIEDVRINYSSVDSTMATVSIPGFIHNEVPGESEYLKCFDYFMIPAGFKAEIEVIDTVCSVLPFKLMEAKTPDADDNNIEVNLTSDNLISDSQVLHAPEKIVELKALSYNGNNHLGCVEIRPIIWNASDCQNHLVSEIKYRIKLIKTGTSLQYTHNYRIPNSLKPLIENLNFLETSGYLKSSSIENSKKEYLILAPLEFEETAYRLSMWKCLNGSRSYVITNDTWNSSSIKNTIIQHYSNHPNLGYIILLGDVDSLPPAETGPDKWNISDYASDIPYVCLSNGYFPDLCIGRVPAKDIATASNMIDKFISYQLNPPLNSSFYKKGVHASYYEVSSNLPNNIESRAFIQTSERIRSKMLENGYDIERIYKAPTNANPLRFNDGSSLPDNLVKPNYSWEGDSKDINKALNNGAYYIFHRDHGSVSSWGNPSYNNFNVDQLSNEGVLPLVFSINCSTGKFQDSGECLAEKFIRKKNGGAAGVIAATGLSPTTHNNTLSLGIFDALLNYDMTTDHDNLTLSDLLVQGIGYVFSKHGLQDSYATYESRIFHCIGDPGTPIYRNMPGSIDNINIKLNNTLSVATDTDALVSAVYQDSGTPFFINSDDVITPLSYPLNIGISASDKRPLIFHIPNEDEINIIGQNILSSGSIEASKVRIGSCNNIDNLLPQEEFTCISDCKLEIKGEVWIGKGVEILKGAELIIK